MNDKQRFAVKTVKECASYLSDEDIAKIGSVCMAAVQKGAVENALAIKDPKLKSKAIAELVEAGFIVLKVED
jgi:hypothetical protein